MLRGLTKDGSLLYNAFGHVPVWVSAFLCIISLAGAVSCNNLDGVGSSSFVVIQRILTACLQNPARCNPLILPLHVYVVGDESVVQAQTLRAEVYRQPHFLIVGRMVAIQPSCSSSSRVIWTSRVEDRNSKLLRTTAGACPQKATHMHRQLRSQMGVADPDLCKSGLVLSFHVTDPFMQYMNTRNRLFHMCGTRIIGL
jgi:hypothetical protein